MLKNIFIFLFLVANSSQVWAQTRVLSGTIRDRKTTEPLPFATIFIPGTTLGTTADAQGFYKLSVPKTIDRGWVAGSFLGYSADSVLILGHKTTFDFNLMPIAGSLGEVVISGTMKETSTLESPILVEVFNPTFFKKNPTPNIFEALAMVNGVQPQLNCNVCNTGDIHINGMEGPYTMVLIDGMPIVSALSTVYGLAGIPNSLVKRIEIVKGPASTLYGSEAVGGLINVITRDAKSAQKLKMDVSTTSWGELNMDFSTKFQVGKAASLVGVSGFLFDKIHDKNGDNFTDVPLQKRISVFNKWDFDRKDNRKSSVAARFIHENRWGGETEFSKKWRGTDSIYGEIIATNRVELIGVYDLPTRRENISFQYSYNYHHQDSYYGTTKYLAAQHTVFGQFLWDKTVRGGHSLLAGLPIRYVSYDDNSPATATNNFENEPRKTALPGIFVQDEWALRKNLTTLLGIRYDRHQKHGHIFTPRVSFKQKIGTNQTLRLSGGNGYRVVNLFTEDHAALTGARQVVIAEALLPEKSWNGNLNFSTQINHRFGFLGLDASLFFTRFSNKIVGDFTSDPQKIIYDNLKGHAISKGFTLNSDFSFLNGVKLMLGATAMDVFQIEQNALGEKLKTPQLFAPKFSATGSASYTISRIGLGIDLTGQLKSPMFLPVLPNDFRPEKSPWFALLNLQLTKKMKGDWEFYGGLKNLLNFVPSHPIMRPFDPFNKQIDVDNPNGFTFDPSYNYAPLQGIRGFFGVRKTFF